MRSRLGLDSHFLEALYVVFLAFCLVLLSSCAHDPAMTKKIDEQTASIPALNAAGRSDAAGKAIAQAPLTEDQKNKLEQLQLSTSAELQQLREENSKLRLLLVRQVMNPESDSREIDAIKKRILETDQKANKRWLAAIDDAQEIIGRKSEHDSRFYKVFMRDSVKPEDTIGADFTK